VLRVFFNTFKRDSAFSRPLLSFGSIASSEPSEVAASFARRSMLRLTYSWPIWLRSAAVKSASLPCSAAVKTPLFLTFSVITRFFCRFSIVSNCGELVEVERRTWVGVDVLN